MGWLFPAVLSTLIASLLLTAAYGYLFSAYRKQYLAFWVTAWGIHSLRYVFLLLMLTYGKSPLLYFATLSMIVISLYFLCMGTAQFIDKEFSPAWKFAFLLILLWVAISVFADFSFLVLTIPLFGFFACVDIWVGFSILRSKFSGGLGKKIVGVTFIVWGLHQADYPFLRPVEWFAPFGYMIGTTCTIVIALGMLILFFERMRADLAKKEYQYRQLFENASYGIAIAHPQTGIIEDCNSAFEAMVKRSRDVIIGMHQKDLHPGDDDMGVVSKTFMQHMGEMAGKTLESKIITGTGEVIDVEIKANIVDLGHGQYMQGFFKDITERKRAKDDLLKNQHLLQKAQEIGKIGTWNLDIINNQLFWTDENCRIFGVPPGSIVNYQLFIEKVHPEDRDYVEQEWSAAMQGKPYDIEHRLFIEGEVRWVREKADVTFDEAGHAISAIGFTQDITDRKEAEQKRIALESSLQQVQKMEALGTLAGGVAHDFNNILGAILGYTELTMMRLNDGSREKENLKHVLSAARRAKDLVQQILTFSRKAAESRQPVQVHLVVGEAMRLLRKTIPKTIDIKQNIARDKDTVLADPTQLHQIVMNLCANANHAMGNGGTLTVALGHVEIGINDENRPPDLDAGEYVKLSIQDTGTGIAPEVLTKVYEPFFTTKPQGKGTGMGLAVVHGIVKSHAGAIHIDSRLGQGTQFDIYLPFHSGDLTAPVARFASSPGGSERILVVDDEPELSNMMSEILKELGYVTQPVSSGTEALERVREAPEAYDLVITDQTMPQMTGAVLTQQIRKIRHDLPVIICTGYSESLDEKRASSIGASALLNKPIETTLMARVVREALDG